MLNVRLAITALSAAALFTIGCRAEDTIKQGADGEYCTSSDVDCRAGHICDRGVCRVQIIDGYNCEAMCQKIEFCDAEETDCLSQCAITIAGDCDIDAPCPWSDEAVESFGRCIVDDLSCQAIVDDNAPQLCYTQIPLDPDRAEVCDAFIASAVACNASVDTDGLMQRCYRLARTAPDASWSRVNVCAVPLEDGICDELEDCLNAVFLIDPPLDLGAGELAEPALP